MLHTVSLTIHHLSLKETNMKKLYTKTLIKAVAEGNREKVAINITSIIREFKYLFSLDELKKLTPREFHAVIAKYYNHISPSLIVDLRAVKWPVVTTASNIATVTTSAVNIALDELCADHEFGEELRTHPATKAFAEAVVEIELKQAMSRVPDEVKNLILEIDKGVESGLNVTGMMSELNKISSTRKEGFDILLETMGVKNGKLISFNYKPVSTKETEEPAPVVEEESTLSPAVDTPTPEAASVMTAADSSAYDPEQDTGMDWDEVVLSDDVLDAIQLGFKPSYLRTDKAREALKVLLQNHRNKLALFKSPELAVIITASPKAVNNWVQHGVPSMDAV